MELRESDFLCIAKHEATLERSQNVVFEGIYRVNRREVKVDICRNAYDQQSYARLYLFDGNEWHLIWSLPYANMACLPLVSYVKRELPAGWYWPDTSALLKVAVNLVRAVD